MPIEQSTTASPAEAVPVSAIENEIPTYRAISPQAVFSLILGCLAILSFAHWFFLRCAVAAVVLGVPRGPEDRPPERRPDRTRARPGRDRARPDLRPRRLTTTAVQNWILVQAGRAVRENLRRRPQ